ncbi:hypothetical protein PACILC2_35730 [Paenibacillus cisolokensis]|uniref:Uncharacterized protein n=1 Tax=Paenibacillus cisolokensis TaxID=1658519 RepID=A0ABQ4N9Y4_9BACL|nr:hypothetical protein PACILC2_35730 [Paenibacillus cisolokensis]
MYANIVKGKNAMLRFMLRPASVIAWCSALMALLMTVFPYAALEASLRGLSIWWEVLFPALFPFSSSPSSCSVSASSIFRQIA